MTTSNKIIAVIMLTGFIAFITLVIYGWIKRHVGVNKDQQPEVFKVEDISIGHTIYDLSPEWREEFEADHMMDEIAATCDLYLAAKELLNDGTADVKRIVQLSDAVSKFEKFAL